ncbi:MAG: anti-phage defense ZorAB system ZorA [Magnetococcales bacterium]|nr:anti-phage defense ZorAB system ZorA [Magnetococcales bacterium]
MNNILLMLPTSMQEIFGVLANELWTVYLPNWVIRAVVFCGLLAAGFFILDFWVRAWWLGKSLKEVIGNCKNIQGKFANNIVNLEAIRTIFATRPRLLHVWNEYTETLHKQQQEDAQGNLFATRWRATTMAEAYFSEHALVDSPLKTEFYKHLPSILTGLGIIGTFSGLIEGLAAFNVSIDPTMVQTSLSNLMQSVSHAFVVSASAISAAMVFTWIEKSMITSRYRQVEELQQLIDSLFDAGIGEEYLERLVLSSENQSTQATQIKDALVAQLREILTELTAQQMESHSRASSHMAEHVGMAIAEHMGGPMGEIAQAVKGVSSNQGEAVNQMLTDVLANFSEHIKEIFGGQMQGMTDLLNQTSETMRATSNHFESLIRGMDATGQKTVDSMAARLADTLSSMDARQQSMNNHISDFITQLHTLNAKSQSTSEQSFREHLSVINDQTGAAVGSLQRQMEESEKGRNIQQQHFQDSIMQAVQTIASQTDSLMKQFDLRQNSVNQQIGEFVAQLRTMNEKSQAESAQIIQEHLSVVGNQTNTVVGSLLRQMEESETKQQIHHERFEAGIAQTLQKISDQMAGLFNQLDQRQLTINQQMGDFVNQLRTMNEKSQADSAQKIQDHLATVGNQTNTVVGSLLRQMEESETKQQTHHERFEAGIAQTLQKISDQMAGLFNQLDQRQLTINQQMGDFVTQLRMMNEKSQGDYATTLQVSLAAISDQVAASTDKLNNLARNADQQHAERQERFEQNTDQAFQMLSEQTRQLVDQTAQLIQTSERTNRSLQDATMQLTAANHETTTRLQHGAETLHSAAAEFAKAGQGVSHTMQAATSAVEVIRESATNLNSASHAIHDVVADYARARDSVVQMVVELKTMIENARKEAFLTSTIVNQLQGAAEQLSKAEREAEEYLRRINDVLLKAHTEFGANVERSLRDGNSKFQEELGTAVSHLSGAVKNLGDYLEELSATTGRR